MSATEAGFSILSAPYLLKIPEVFSQAKLAMFAILGRQLPSYLLLAMLGLLASLPDAGAAPTDGAPNIPPSPICFEDR